MTLQLQVALTAGTRLGQYEIRAPLGAGGMGEVYRAYDSRLDREVAIKVLPSSLTRDLERMRRFEQEARATAALNHPNILAVHQMATDDGISYLVEELLEGESLRERLRRGPIGLRKAIEYAAQIAHGLAAAHDRGIVHRDLKPENLFVTKDGRVKILDFGLAKLTQPQPPSPTDITVTQSTEPGIVMGTAGYMSPEQVRGKEADHRSDLFAFGTILYEMVTGKQTFRKATSAETMTAILNDDPPAISQITPTAPPGLQRVVHRCLEKNPEERFQSASDLAFALEALSDSDTTPVSGSRANAGLSSRRVARAGAALLVVFAAAVLAYFWLKPPVAPKVSNYIQLTHDGQPKYLIGTDGARLYLYLTVHDYIGMAEMSTAGGEMRRVPLLPAPNYLPVNLSPDGAELIVSDAHGEPHQGPFWSVPVVGGSPRKLGNTEGVDAAWSPDGKWLAYTKGNELYVATADGADPRKLATMKDAAYLSNIAWSPDGSRLRFDVKGTLQGSLIWEVEADGSGLHQLFPGWSHAPDYECCGRWTADGKYFLFMSRGQVWALPRKPPFLHSQAEPAQLTSSPMLMSTPFSSADGKKLYTVGATYRGELFRYDVKSDRLEPYLGGISAEYLAFSRDGQWVAYVSYPEGTLWRSKVDGSERLQLSYPPGYAFMPRWSPDGKTIIYFEDVSGKHTRIYQVASAGGTPQPLLPDDPNSQEDPNWSPDGSKIVFGADSNNPASSVRVLDLKTRQISTLPGSQGLFSPRWSADGRYVPALSSDSKRLLLFDFQTQKWTEMASGTLGWLNWSRDGQSLYFLDLSGVGALLRLRLSDGKVEQVAKSKDKNFVSEGKVGVSLSLAPDDSPLLLRHAGTQDAYALDWEEP